MISYRKFKVKLNLTVTNQNDSKNILNQASIKFVLKFFNQNVCFLSSAGSGQSGLKKSRHFRWASDNPKTTKFIKVDFQKSKKGITFGGFSDSEALTQCPVNPWTVSDSYQRSISFLK